MSKLIAENLIVYKMRSKDFDEKTLKEYNAFITGAGGPVYCILQDSKGSKLVDKLSEDKINIDKLFSPDIEKAKKLNDLLAENTTYEIPARTREEIRKDVEDSFRDIFESEMSPKDLERYAKEILELSKGIGKSILKREDILFMSQLTENGWVCSPHLYGGRIKPSIRRKYEGYGLIKTKILKNSQLFFVKLTNGGKKIQEDILEKYKTYSKTSETENST